MARENDPAVVPAVTVAAAEQVGIQLEKPIEPEVSIYEASAGRPAMLNPTGTVQGGVAQVIVMTKLIDFPVSIVPNVGAAVTVR